MRNANGDEVILAGGRVGVLQRESGLGFDMAYRPGSLKEMLRQMASGVLRSLDSVDRESVR